MSTLCPGILGMGPDGIPNRDSGADWRYLDDDRSSAALEARVDDLEKRAGRNCAGIRNCP